MAAIEKTPIVFFDGVCNLCNGAVDFLLRFDRTGQLKFAPLQGESARELLSPHVRQLDSIVFYCDEQVLTRSSAAFALMKYLSWPWRWFKIFKILPRAATDWIYQRVAANRYRWFGKRDTCRLPSAREKVRFLE